MQQADIYLKDEGDFVSVFFQSKEAQEVADNEQFPMCHSEVYKIDVGYNEASKMANFAVLHGLSLDSDLDMTLINEND